MALILLLNFDMSSTPVLYKEIKGTISNEPLTIQTLLVDMNNQSVEVDNVLSKDVIYGLEKTSEMSKRTEAVAAVNGVFYDNYGHHIGGMMLEGNWATIPSAGLPTMRISKDNKVTLEEVDISLWLTKGEKDYQIQGLNRRYYNNRELLLFNKLHGSTTRVYGDVMNFIIDNGSIVNIVRATEPLKIQGNQYILVDVSGKNRMELRVGDQVSLTLKESRQGNILKRSLSMSGDLYELEAGAQSDEEVFQTSSWLLKDGEVVAVGEDPVIGYTYNREPRTVLGVTENNKLVIVVVDGRQKGYSVGLSGEETAQLMQRLGCYNAVYLDGGASSTMVVKDQLVNRPSNKKERLVGHSIIIKRKQEDNNLKEGANEE